MRTIFIAIPPENVKGWQAMPASPFDVLRACFLTA